MVWNYFSNWFSFRRKYRLKMEPGAHYIPKDRHLSPQGEDAHFICEEKQTIGVADGVGGWIEKGIDSGDYARNLMLNSVKVVEKQTIGRIDPKQVLNEAFWRTREKGSSTACIMTLKGNHLHAVNIGDSSFIRIRKGENGIYRSPIQLHKSNEPYQLGRRSDNPSLANEFKVAVKPGDIIVLGTDGLFNNMFMNQIKEEVEAEFQKGLDSKQVAYRLARLAWYSSRDNHSVTPYSKAAKKGPYGGKPDDITVIVARIVHHNATTN